MYIDDIYIDYNNSLSNIDEIYNNFKRDHSFTNILEHVSIPFGIEYKKLIEQEYFINIENYLNLIYNNDSIGNPNLHLIDNINTSPSNFRYIYHSLLIQSKLRNWFNTKNLKIIEIGGGYGGLCYYIKNIIKDYDIDYSIIDLPNVNSLQCKFLNDVNIKCNLYSCNNIDEMEKEYDLIISNYCLSEISIQNRIEYLSRIIPNCKKEFYIWNSLSFEGLNLSKYIIEDEKPQTNYEGYNKFVYNKF